MEIDAILRRYPWLDMSIVKDTGHDLVLWGSISESYPPAVEITLKDVLAVAARRGWHTDTSSEVIREIVDRDFNRAYGIEVGYRTFEFVAEDHPTTMRFAARSIRLEIKL